MNKYELAKKINELEGLTNEEKSELLKLLRSQKKYGLVWEDKPEDAEQRMLNEQPVLEEVPERAIISDDADAPNHILIEGDNLEALTVLSYTHSGKIDVIYIDPPYNTGNKDFVYNDSFVDKEDGYRHSKWLSFMNKRLRIAKGLLSERGMIFISIDDNEQAQLRLLCDEIFGQDNCLVNMVWDLGSGTSAGHFTRAHEYILVYCLNRANIPNFSGGEGIIDDRALKKKSIKNAEFAYHFKAGTKFEVKDGLEFTDEWGGSEKTRLISGRFICEDNKLKYDVVLSACWTQKNQMDSFFSGKETYDTKGQKVLEFYFRDNGKLYCRKARGTINPPSVLRNVATTKQGSSLLKEMFDGKVVFDFSKPIKLLMFLLSLRPNDSQVLDFFAGSGTTLHATMQLNAEDGGHRQCILVTNNENGICENVTYERNRRVIQGYTTPKGEEVAGLTHNNLRYYKTKFVPRDKSPKNLRELMKLSTDMLCIHNDAYIEKPFAGKNINKNIARYFENNDGSKRMLVIFLEDAIPAIVQLIKQNPVGKLMVYVFSANGYAFDDEFEDVANLVELCAMPDALLNAYRRVLPKRKPQLLEDSGEEVESENRTTEEMDLFDEQTYTEAAREINFNKEGGAE